MIAIKAATLSLLTALALPNSPYPKDITVIPSINVELSTPWKPAYIEIENSARCIPGEWNRWNPITALWRIEGGIRFWQVRLGVGHQSEHGVDTVWRATESRDYVRLEIKLK